MLTKKSSSWLPSLPGILAIVAIAAIFVASNASLPLEPASTSDQPIEESLSDEGLAWLKTPQKLAANLKLVKNDETTSYASVDYYKVGADNGQDVIIAKVPPTEMGDNDYLFFIKTGPEQYSLLAKVISNFYFETSESLPLNKRKYTGPELAPGVNFDYIRNYQSIIPPQELSIRGVTLTPGNINGIWGNNFFFFEYQTQPDTKLTEFTATPYGTLYSRVEHGGLSGATQNFVLKLADGQAVAYQYTPSFFSADGTPKITWNDGTTATTGYVSDSGGGCGSPGRLGIVEKMDENTLQVAGRTNTNESVYEFKDPANNLARKFYDNFLPQGIYREYSGQGDAKEIPLSFSDYVAQHGIFVYKDPLGRYLVYRNWQFGPQAECGKPVIYLYPTTPTNVSVKVDARITKSEPTYNQGWNVLAQPNGTLTTQDNQTYDSLFWEGTGHAYPDITSGAVVAQADLETTLRAQLPQLGLNAKEAQDFLEFWLPKMPTTPYTRLTWFGTKQMDALAPLAITPQPDTMIRIFLDFVGLDKPISLPPQRLKSPERRGFTVVEWGGLLQK